jgi:hypothetical protein
LLFLSPQTSPQLLLFFKKISASFGIGWELGRVACEVLGIKDLNSFE